MKLKTTSGEYIDDMEPAEKMARVLVKLVLLVFALIISLVFDEFGFGHGKFGFVIWIVGAAFGAIALGSGKASDATRKHR